MDLFSKNTIKNLLKERQFQASKGLGQNFLINKTAAKKLIDSAELKGADIVLEIGPGLGSLTKELALEAGKVIAIEKDQRMIEILKETLGDFKNIEVIQGDIRKIPLAELGLAEYKTVSNLPFYLTAPLIRLLLEHPHAPSLMAFIVQKEVAQRICAKPPDINMLAVSVQYYASAKIIAYVPKRSFWPEPKVDCAIVRIIPQKRTAGTDTDLFFKIVHSGFLQPRKQIQNNLSSGLKKEKDKIKNWLLDNSISPERRAETLSIQEWIQLTHNFKSLS